MVQSPHRNAGQGHNVRTDNSSFEKVEQFKYLGATLTCQNFIQEETKSRLKSRNACYHSVQNLSPSILLSKHTKIKICRNIMLPVFFMGVKHRRRNLG